MTIGIKGLPPVSTLIVLEAVVRHRSFTQAAKELRVTQAAISQQIRGLEDDLRIELIRRERPQIRNTVEAELLATATRQGIDGIRTAVEAIRRRPDVNHLSIAALTSFASFWLMPRLPKFFAEFPELEVNLLARDREIQRGDEGFDVGVNYPGTPRRGFQVHTLFRDELMAVCSPVFLASRPELQSVHDLAKAYLIDLVTDDPWMGWDEWFACFGAARHADKKGLQVTSYVLAIQAALDGQGVALGWRRLIEPLLQREALVPVVPERARPDGAYALLVPNRNLHNPAVEKFRRWILREAAVDRGQVVIEPT